MAVLIFLGGCDYVHDCVRAYVSVSFYFSNNLSVCMCLRCVSVWFLVFGPACACFSVLYLCHFNLRHGSTCVCVYALCQSRLILVYGSAWYGSMLCELI